VNDELDVLEMVLYEIYPVVDVIILGESNMTYKKTPKPLFYEAHKQYFKKYADKIRHVLVDYSNCAGDRDPWFCERYQRAALVRGAYDMADDDILFVGDADELTSRMYLSAVKGCIPFSDLYDAKGKAVIENCNIRSTINFQFFYHFDCFRYNHFWHPSYTSGICLKRKKEDDSRAIDTEQLRMKLGTGHMKKSDPPRNRFTGWHVRSFMTLAGYRHKLSQSTEIDYNTPEINHAEMSRERMRLCKDVSLANQNHKNKYSFLLNSEKILKALPKIVSEPNNLETSHFLHYVPDWQSKFNLSYHTDCPQIDEGFKPGHVGRELGIGKKFKYQCKSHVYLGQTNSVP